MNDPFTKEREIMVQSQIKERGITNQNLLNVMKEIPRHLFIGKNLESEAYYDYPVPIGYGQTISQPYIVALMTELLNPDKTKKVLEIGTGSGYQTAILASLAEHVYTIERIEELHTKSRQTLSDLGYKNISFLLGDGYKGWTEHSPYDCIIVTAAPEYTPFAILEQLKERGRLVIPTGNIFVQTLKLITKNNDKYDEQDITGVRFVKMVKD
jgi:protein-L-isoaspartate(D-aspartate) O-methyltransferase